MSRPELLGNNPITISSNYKYLSEVLHLDKATIQDMPSLLSENPDSFARKMRILKIAILELKPNEEFNPNDYKDFAITSPATIMAKKDYCIENNLDYKNNPTWLKITWKKLMRKIKPNITQEGANKEKLKRTTPYKQGYDLWMKEYRKHGKKFYARRKRRIITRL